MSKRIRNILILLFGIIFFIGAPSALLYSQGYRVDLKNGDLVRTGGFYFKIHPKPYKVYLNGKLKQESGLLFDRIFLKNLLPKSYNIRITKKGYFPWEKNLSVKQGMVTEAKNITLFPKNPGFSAILENTEDFFFSPNQRKVILKRFNQNGGYLQILDLEKQTPKTILTPSDLEYQKIQFLDVKWGAQNQKILIKTKAQKKEKHFVLDLSEKQIKIFPLNYLGKVEKISLNPKDSSQVIFLKNTRGTTNLFKSNYPEQEAPVILIKRVSNYSISKENIFWFNLDGFLYQADLSGQASKIINTTPFSFKKESPYRLLPLFEDLIFVYQKDHLFQLNPDLKRFEKIAHSVETFKISPDYRKIVFSEGHEIKILFLEDILGQPKREAHQEISLFRFSKPINHLSWLNSNYLIFQAGDILKISEIDNRDQINCYNLGEFKNLQLSLNRQFKKIFILSNNTFYSSQKIVR